MARRFYGKYRGIAVNAVDPQAMGRVLVQVPAVLGKASAWAMPCVPMAGLLALPDPGARLWVEFEGGHASQPIWVGGYFADPGSAPSTGISLQTAGGTALRLSDDPTAQLVLTNGAGPTISIGNSGITITNGLGATIKLEGPMVSINGDALVVI